MLGFDVHSAYFPVKLTGVVLLAAFLFYMSYLDAWLLKQKHLPAKKVEAMFADMILNALKHAPLREQYYRYRNKNCKTPLTILAMYAQVAGLVSHVANNRIYFYTLDSGFMTVIPVSHVHRQ